MEMRPSTNATHLMKCSKRKRRTFSPVTNTSSRDVRLSVVRVLLATRILMKWQLCFWQTLLCHYNTPSVEQGMYRTHLSEVQVCVLQFYIVAHHWCHTSLFNSETDFRQYGVVQLPVHAKGSMNLGGATDSTCLITDGAKEIPALFSADATSFRLWLAKSLQPFIHQAFISNSEWHKKNQPFLIVTLYI